MKKISIFFASLLLMGIYTAYGQENTGKDLVVNGDFESGNTGFHSDFIYNAYQVSPGYYSVTPRASSLNPDYTEPLGGDHTFGDGNFLIVDSDGKPGKKVWYTTVDIIPNSNYIFTASFCNLFRHKGSNSGFVINGMASENHPKQNDCRIRLMINNQMVGESEADLFHMFRWIRTGAAWYSGNTSGKTEIAIINENTSATGNDLALDDIEFLYIETMPAGYKPPEKTTILAKKISNDVPDPQFQLAELKKTIREKALAQRSRQLDSLAPGIYLLNRRKPVLRHPRFFFAQGQSELLPEVLTGIDSLVAWMKEDHKVRILLEGHTDNRGDSLLNVKLSEERVNRIKQYMISKGIDASRIETKGYGGAHPMADNSEEATRKFNRRVEIKILDY